jgi:hypothetical protein
MPLPRLSIVSFEGTLAPELEAILKRRLKKKRRRAEAEVLVHLKGTSEQDTTWEDLEELRSSFPDLVDKVL